MKEVSAGGVVYRKAGVQLEFLMIEDRYGKWTLPKGKQESGESVEETALREIREETGIDGRIVSRLTTVNYQFDHPERGKVDKEVHYFLVEHTAGVETPQLEEIKQLEWLTADRVRERQQRYGYDTNREVWESALHLIGRS